MSRPKDTTPKSSKAWVRLPLALLRAEGLTPTDCTILAIIIDLCYEHTDRRCHIERDSIAGSAGCSVRQVSASVAKLQRLQLIERTDTGRVALYTLTGAVSILPPKRQRQTPAAAAPARRSERRTLDPDPNFDVEGYLSLVNNFRQLDPDPDPEEELPGQLTFD